jgi:AcrR family transcriptional regulator
VSRPEPVDERAAARGNGNDDSTRWTLPRGRHRIPRDLVAAHQRERLLAAAAAAVAEHGHSSLTVQHVVARAGMSRSTFYEHFENKHACVLAAYSAAFDRLLSVITRACASRQEWPEGAAAAICAALDFTTESSTQAGLLVSNALATDPQFAPSVVATQDHLAALLRTGREHCTGLPATLDLTEQALVGATMAIVAGRLMNDELDRIPQLKPELVELILTPYIGKDEARRLALAA